MAIVMIHSRPLPFAVHSSHLRTSHLPPARACSSTGLPFPHVLRARYAVHPAPLPTRLLLLAPSSSNGSKIDGNVLLGGGGCAGDGGDGAGGSRSGKPGSGDEDDRSVEGFGVLNCIVKLIHRLLQLGILKEPLLFCSILATEEMLCSSSSHSMHEIKLMGDEESHCDGSGHDQLKVTRDNHTDESGRTARVVLKITRDSHADESSRTAQVGTRTKNTQDHRVDMSNSDDEISSDENERKMKGRRSYVLNMAASSLAGALFLVPYWGFSCSDTTLSIDKTWKDVVPIGYSFLLITAVLVTAHSSQFKDGELPDNVGFKLLQIALALVLVCLCAGIFIPQHVCRGMSDWLVWTSAAGALLLIVISWSTVFQQKTVIKCIKAPYQMVIDCTKVMYKQFQQWRLYLSLPEYIKAKFKKMPEGKSYPGVTMEQV